MKGDLGSVDISTEKNMEGLVEVGEALLKKRVSRVNLETGHYQPISENVTNEEALKRFHNFLSKTKEHIIYHLSIIIVDLICKILLIITGLQKFCQKKGNSENQDLLQSRSDVCLS